MFFPSRIFPREDFSSNRSSELKNPNRAGEIYRAEIEFGKNSQDFSFKSLLNEGERSESLQDDPKIRRILSSEICPKIFFLTGIITTIERQKAKDLYTLCSSLF